MNIFLTDKIYFHFVDENDDDIGCPDNGIDGDSRKYSSVSSKDRDDRGRGREISPSVC